MSSQEGHPIQKSTTLARAIEIWIRSIATAMHLTGNGYRRQSQRATGQRAWVNHKSPLDRHSHWIQDGPLDTRDDKVDKDGRRISSLLRRYTARYDSPAPRNGLSGASR